MSSAREGKDYSRSDCQDRAAERRTQSLQSRSTGSEDTREEIVEGNNLLRSKMKDCSDEAARFKSEAQTLRSELEGEKDRVIRLEQSSKARNNAGSAVECLENAKAVKEEGQVSSKLSATSDKLYAVNNSLKDKEAEIDELHKTMNDTLNEKEAIIVEMSNKQHAKDIKLATAEQENAAMAAELARVKAELKDLKEKTLLETVCSVASEVISYIPFRKKRKIR